MDRHEQFIQDLELKFGSEDNAQIRVAIQTLKELAKIKQRLDKIESQLDKRDEK